MFKKVLIANRGAIATRVIRTLKEMGIVSVAVYHDADAASLHVQHADEAFSLGEGSVADTYLDIAQIIAIAKRAGAQAIHPGYGFLSENTDFVQACEENNIAFIGPTPNQINAFGLKHTARDIAHNANVPLVPGSGLLTHVDEAKAFAQNIGYPIMLKSTAGGGGIGMQVCQSENELASAWVSVKRLGENYFANDGVFIEKYIGQARHIEVQIFGDGQGNVVSFGERDCSAQRRNQKVLEECPAPNLDEPSRQALHQTAERLMASVSYRNAGTVEFIYDTQENTFYFLEVNTRLQVEHGVTEEVWGIDLVKLMVEQAAQSAPDLHAFKHALKPQGHAVQLRLYAEDPTSDFMPSSGIISQLYFPTGDNIRIDHWLESGTEVSALFDPMLAKIITKGRNRQDALNHLSQVLTDTQLYGIQTNKEYGLALIASPLCVNEKIQTHSLHSFEFTSHSISVLDGGTQTTVQDYPARMGYWSIGVPPSGPMDSVNFRLANTLLGNAADSAGLEITLSGPTLRFNCDTAIAITGALLEVSLDDSVCKQNTVVVVKKGQILKLGRVTLAGARAYLAVLGGFDCATYLGSKSTFILGQFGGLGGGALKPGQVLPISSIASDGHTNSSNSSSSNTSDTSKSPQENTVSSTTERTQKALSALPIKTLAMPELTDSWEIRVVYGPHGAPDFFTRKDIDTFLAHTWEVHFNSSRTGVRLTGPKPEWARADGGEAGLHPSNIHDNAYAFGAIDFTGDMPVILGPDGPSLGGFVCPFTVISADLWKLGQLKAGAKITFIPTTLAQAQALETVQIEQLSQGKFCDPQPEHVIDFDTESQSPICARFELHDEPITVRLAGDHFLLIELGPQELDIARRLKIHALMEAFNQLSINGVIDVTPGIRSLQIHYDAQYLPYETLLNAISDAINALENADDMTVASRIVHLPLSWDDPACQESITKYTQSVRPNAPWCPSNLDFIRRINGLDSIKQVKNTVFDASYLVMGLGDVYLGAPVATPIDPRHRLVTTKYNPARTWTAENSVGIGGAYMCVYGMEGPGGYQFVGRTLQMWTRYKQTAEFTQPWLLRFFDQIKFYEVSAEELAVIRREFPKGNYPLKIEEVSFSLNEYTAFLNKHDDGIRAFSSQRQTAFNEELALWKATGQLTYEQKDDNRQALQNDIAPEGTAIIDSSVAGNIWLCEKAEGDTVKKGDTLIVVESMKMEFVLSAPCDGVISKCLTQKGDTIATGEALMWITPT